ncbi:hypothetical protein [Streptomyces noursei]|uniref:hypothetical protein n=1 Tax=Streptomyces noursei TaxID=1971 RepID=UPI00167BA909|nr:hypothetical protein [Streptomyces noursei]MCZ1015636.1 hypothetical protein [Streptomyces noursei]GGW89640.1 hypothetical protein GCM10010341_08110 [Streptomyces noursei]
MPGARTRRIARIRETLPFAEELEGLTREAHEGASFRIDRAEFTHLWYATPITRTRDSRPLEESNWTVITHDLEEKHPEGVESHSFGHWGHGWYERLYVRRDDAAAICAVQDWVTRLADYGIADEEHHSELEWEANHQIGTQCWSSDPDCPCEANTHNCADMLAVGIESGDIAADASEWYCNFCSEWYEMDSEWRQRAHSAAYRRECAALEEAGQLALSLV